MTEIRVSEYFAIIPEWVLHADISANAVRLYGVLNRFANSRGHAWPSRKTIADLMGVSVATIDRAKEELVDLGALTIKPRTTPSGDPSSNLYILHISHVENSGPLSPMRQGLLTREGRGTPTDDDLKKDSMKQRKNIPHSCAECLNKYKTGHDDGTEGLSHIWISETRTFTVCPTCDGTGQEPAR
jgi:DNA-binding transcriptional MocR family regulator